MKRLFHTMIAAVAGLLASVFAGPPSFRVRTCDVAFNYRMGVGFPGDVNRMHPASIVPGLLDGANAFRFYGELAKFGTGNNYRPVIAADQSATAMKVAGAIVRPYPTQQTTGGMTSAIGAATPPTAGVADFLHSGFIMAKMKAGVAVKKGDSVWVWAVATETVNIQGELQAAAVTDKTVPITNARFNGPADALGNVEVEIWAA